MLNEIPGITGHPYGLISPADTVQYPFDTIPFHLVYIVSLPFVGKAEGSWLSGYGRPYLILIPLGNPGSHSIDILFHHPVGCTVPVPFSCRIGCHGGSLSLLILPPLPVGGFLHTLSGQQGFRFIPYFRHRSVQLLSCYLEIFYGFCQFVFQGQVVFTVYPSYAQTAFYLFIQMCILFSLFQMQQCHGGLADVVIYLSSHSLGFHLRQTLCPFRGVQHTVCFLPDSLFREQALSLLFFFSFRGRLCSFFQ